MKRRSLGLVDISLLVSVDEARVFFLPVILTCLGSVMLLLCVTPEPGFFELKLPILSIKNKN